MNVDSAQDGLRQGVGSMLALESRLVERLSRLSAETSEILVVRGQAAGTYQEAP